jgi:hypothetical protein
MNPRKLAWALIFLAFLSKVSLNFTGLVPNSLGYLVFQGGLHPYLNVLLNLSLGFFLMVALRGARGELAVLTGYRKSYVFFALGTVVLLWLQHSLQIVAGLDEAGAGLVFVTMFCTSFLVYIFGLVIPRLIPASEFVKGVAIICSVICGLSVLLLLAGMPALYKGSRFVGVLKHIPYMVTCGTVGFLFTLHLWNPAGRLRHHFGILIMQLFNAYALVLTGTRSAVFAVLAGSFVYFVTLRAPSPNFRVARVLLVWLTLVGAGLFGTMAYDFGRDLLTGKTAIGSRAPQDGVSDRMDEVYRGLEMLDKSPWFGLGLLSKFSAGDGEDVVDSYNSFQDPHNLFISSAVVAGYPFGFWVMFGFFLALAGCGAAVLRAQPGTHVIGVYLLSHLPILAIYHMHLSLGGMADRLYWLVFGYLGLKWAIVPQKDSVRIAESPAKA